MANFPDIKRIQADDEGDFLEISQGCLSPSRIMLEAVCTDDGEETHVQLALPFQSAYALYDTLGDLILKCIHHLGDTYPVDFSNPIEIPKKELDHDNRSNPNPPTTRRHFMRNHLTLLLGGKRNRDISEHGN